MTQIIHDYVKQMLETSEKTRVMNVFDEYERIQSYFAKKGIVMHDLMTQSIEEEIYEVFCEDYIHDYSYKNPGEAYFTRPLTEREITENARKKLLGVVSAHNDSETFEDLLDFLEFEYANPYELKKRYDLDEEQCYDLEVYTYYEMICTHKETGLELICFLGSDAAGSSYGFELTKENWLAHIEQLKDRVREATKDAKVQNHVWIECEFFDGVDDATKREVLDLAGNLGIIEGRAISNEAIDHHMKNSEHLAKVFKDVSHSDIRSLVDYALDCLNAKCRENGDPEIY